MYGPVKSQTLILQKEKYILYVGSGSLYADLVIMEVSMIF